MPTSFKEKSFKASLNHDDVLVNKNKEESKNIKDGYYYINKNINQAQDIKIYEDDKLSKELKSDEKTNKNYQIYIDEANSSNNQNQSNTNILQSQIDQTNINQDTKYGINLLSKDNMNSFINSFNESKSITRVDKGMWEDGDKEVKVLIDIKDYPFTLSMLKQVFTNIKADQEYILQEMVDELNRRDTDGVQMYVKYKLDTRHRLEHFFGQCFVEAQDSGNFELEESLRFSNTTLKRVFTFVTEDEAKMYGKIKNVQEANREAIANIIYDDNRRKPANWSLIGNTQEGDGWKYRGRGIKQLTGKDNYKGFNNFSHANQWVENDINFLDSPDLLVQDGKYALMSATYFWTTARKKNKKKLYETADESKLDSNNNDIVERITAVINPKKLGLEYRKESYKRIREANIFNMF